MSDQNKRGCELFNGLKGSVVFFLENLYADNDLFDESLQYFFLRY